MNEKRFFLYFILASAVLLTILAFSFNGLGDSGDSIMHYQFARYAFIRPDNFFNSWAKPLFVLFAAPFAQFGFIGIKLFNSANTIIAMVAVYLVARRLNISNSWLAPILLLLAPMSFGLSQSGLTEPLFASVLIAGLCLLFYNYSITGLIVLSFLPFIRSEGLFLLIPVLVYMCAQKKYVSIVWLATGQILYGIIGYFHFHSLLWFYQSNPYSFVSNYGHGDWIHYFLNMPVITGPASCYLLAAGFLSIPMFFFIRKDGNSLSISLVLIWVIFIMYFFFHVIAWRFGLFSSYGMVRIIAGVTPLIAIIATYGYNKTEELIKHILSNKNEIGKYCIALVLAMNAIYLLVKINGNSGASGIGLTPSADQVIESKMADYIKTKYADYKKLPVFFNAPYISLALDLDPTGISNNPMATKQDGNYLPNSLYIWDDWFSVVEGKITLESLTSNSTLKKDTAFSQIDKSGKLRTVVLFKKL